MVDILLATYNGIKYIEEQLVSIFEQTYTNYHLYIRDDGSEDETVRTIERLVTDYGMDDKVTIIDDGEATGSAKKNFTRLCTYSDSEYTMFSDQDDIWHKDKIEITLKRMKKLEAAYGNDVPFLVHTDLTVVDEEKNLIADSIKEYMQLPVKENIKALLLQNSVTGCSMMLNKSAMRLMKKADEEGAFIIHDHFAAVVVALFGHVSYIDKSTADYRQHSGNQIGAADAASFKYKLNRFVRGKDDFQKEMEACYSQAEYILDVFKDELDKVNADKVECVRRFSQLKSMSSREKRAFFREYGMYKRGTLKSIVQMLWC